MNNHVMSIPHLYIECILCDTLIQFEWYAIDMEVIE